MNRVGGDVLGDQESTVEVQAKEVHYRELEHCCQVWVKGAPKSEQRVPVVLVGLVFETVPWMVVGVAGGLPPVEASVEARQPSCLCSYGQEIPEHGSCRYRGQVQILHGKYSHARRSDWSVQSWISELHNLCSLRLVCLAFLWFHDF